MKDSLAEQEHRVEYWIRKLKSFIGREIFDKVGNSNVPILLTATHADVASLGRKKGAVPPDLVKLADKFRDQVNILGPFLTSASSGLGIK